MWNLNKAHKEKAELIAHTLKTNGKENAIKDHLNGWESKKAQYVKELSELEAKMQYAPNSFELLDDSLSIPSSIFSTERGIEVCDIYIQTYKEAL